MLLRTDLDTYKYDRTGLFIMVPYITLKKGVLHDSYYGILLHAVQIRRKMFFWFFVGDIIIYYYNFILMHSYCHSSTKCSTTATLQTELFNRKKRTSILHSNKFERNTDFTDHCPLSEGSTVRMVRSCENNYFPCSAT